MKNLLSKQREIVAILLYGLIVAALFYFLIMPLIGSINDRSNQIQEENMKQESTANRLKDLPRIQSQFKMLNEGTGASEILLNKKNQVVLIEKLEKLAESTGNDISFVVMQNKVDQQKTAPKNTKAKVDESLMGKLPSQEFLQIQIILVGKYDSIRNFMRLLGDFEYYNDIVSIQIAMDDDSEAGIKRQSSDGVIADPFSVIPTDPISSPQPEAVNKLKASLDTVFYSKKEN